MFDYLQKFNNLPKDLRDQVSSSVVMKALSELEAKYKVDLAMTVMKVMIKDLAVDNLPIYFVSHLTLDSDKAESLAKEMKEKVFSKALFKATPPVAEVVEKSLDLNSDTASLVKEIGLLLPSEALIKRFRNILTTYIKGIRNKIDTRATLEKDVERGGLNLNSEQTDKVFKVCDKKTFKNLTPSFKATTPPPSRLDKIINQADKRSVPAAEYNLKKAISEKRINRPELDTSHELPLPVEAKEKRLPLPKEATEKRLAAPSKAQEKKLSAPQEKKHIVVPPPLKPVIVPKPKEVIMQARPVVPPRAVVKPVAPKVPQKIEKPKRKGVDLWGKMFKSEKKDKPVPQALSVQAKPENSSIASKRSAHRDVVAQKSTRSAPAPSVSKPSVHDIKPIPKVMGPIEELQYLSLVDFRRLGKTPEDIVSKVFSKIKLLESEGYDKMIAGVKAWRQSPANRLYLRIGQEAINKNLSMQKSAEARQAAGKDYLSIDEIEAIIVLNSKLIF